jgi:hypothetical protein
MIALAAGSPDWLAAIMAAGSGAIVLRLAQVALQWRKQSADELAAKSSTGLEIKRHRDGLTVQMLEMAREELRTARTEIAELRREMRVHVDEIERLRRIELRVAAYEEALVHIEALIMADFDGGREAAEHAARIYLAKMEALKLTLGAEANAEQVERARRLRERRDGE